MRIPDWMETKMAGVEDGHMMVNIRVRIWHPGFWWFALRKRVAIAVHNRAFEWVHRHDDHVRVWQDGETCTGCENCSAPTVIHECDRQEIDRVARAAELGMVRAMNRAGVYVRGAQHIYGKGGEE